MQLCELVSLQRYTKALSGTQRASLVEKSRQKPHERMRALTDALRTSNYGSDPLLRESGIVINTQFAQVDARVLPAPKVVSSRKWPSISNYRASVRTQSPKVEMIDALFKPVAGNEDHDMFMFCYFSNFQRLKFCFVISATSSK